MAQYIKKVGTTPTRGNGFIIDSFNTNDDKMFNAPSLGAVERRTDNNLIFGSNFLDITEAGAHDDASICGWTISGSDIDQFMPQFGMIISGEGTHVITSPRFTDILGSAFSARPAFSLSMEIEQGSYSSGEDHRDPFIAKIENINYPYDPAPSPGYEDERGYFTLQVTELTGGYLSISFINSTSKQFYIRWIKLEVGSSCTPYLRLNKDTSIRDAFNKALNDLIIVEKVTVNLTMPLPPYAGAEMGGALNITMPGYTALGVVGYKLPNVVSASQLYTMYLLNAGDMLYYVLTNLTSSERDTTFDAYIMYKKNF